MNEAIISATVDIVEQLLGHDSPQPEVITALERVLAGRRRKARMVRPVELFADWIPLDPLALPDPKLGPYLTVNNHKARNAWGLPSHVFLVGMFHASSGPEGPVSAFSDGDLRQIHACAFYKPVFAAIPSPAPPQSREIAPQDRLSRDRDIILQAINEYDEWLLDDDFETNAILRKIMERMRERIHFTDPPPPQSGEREVEAGDGADVRPVRLQLSRAKGFNLQRLSLATNGLPAVNCARPTLLGNPFKIGEPGGCDFNDGGDPTPLIPAMTREQCIDFFRDISSGFLKPEHYPHGHRHIDRWRSRVKGMSIAEYARSFLRGHNLACRCGLDEACHVDVLLQLAGVSA